MAPNELAGVTGQGDGKAIHNSKNKDQLAEAGRRKLEEFRRKQREKAAAPKKSPTGLAPTPTPTTPSTLPPPPPLSQVSTNHETLVVPEIAPPIRAPPIKPPSSTSSSPVPSPHPAAPALATIPLRSSPHSMPPSTSATATGASSLSSENHNRASTAAPEGNQSQGSYNAFAHSSFHPPPPQGQTERSRATPFASRPLFDTSRAESKPFGGLSPMERQSDSNPSLTKASPPPLLNNFRPSPPTFSNTRAPALQHREKGTAPPTPLEGPPTTQERGRSSSSLEPSLQSVLLTEPGPGSRSSSNSYPPHLDSDQPAPAPPLPPSHDTPSASPVLSAAVAALPAEKVAVAKAPYFVPAVPNFSPPNGRQALPETSKSDLETSGPEAAKSASSTSASSASVSSRASSIWSFVAPMPASKQATKSSTVPIPPPATLPQTSAPTVPDLPQPSAEPSPPPSSTQPPKPPSADTSPPTQLPHKPPPSSKPDPALLITKTQPTSSPDPTPPANAEKEPPTLQAPPVTPSLAPEPPKPSPNDSKTLVSPAAKQPGADKAESPSKAIKSSTASTPIETLLAPPPSKPFKKQALPPPPSALSRDPIKQPRAALPPSSLRPSLPPPPPFLPPRKAELPASSPLGGEEARGSTTSGFDFVGLLSSRQQQEGEVQQSTASAAIAARGAEVDRWRKSGELPPPPSQASASPLGGEQRGAPVAKEGAAMNGKARTGGGGGAMWGSEFGALEQHIEDLTQEKYALQRGLDAARALAESLANENEALTETFNRQGQVVAQLQAEIDKLGEEIQAQKVVVTAAQEERERALGESSASAERSRSLAAENVALEEKILRLRSNELKLERDIQSLRNEIENGKRTVAMMDKDRSSMRSTIDALQEDKRGLQVRLRKAALGGVLESVRGPQVNRVEASTSTDDLAPPIPSPPPPTPNLASEDTAQSALPSMSPTSSYTIPLEDNEPSSTSLSEASRAPPGSAPAEPAPPARAASFAPLRSLGTRVRNNSFSIADLSSIPDDEARTIESIDRLITELTEERRAVHMALQAEVASSAELRTANSELSRKLAVQTQRLELAVAQNMARQSNGESSSHTPQEEEIIDFAPEYMDENDEVVERVLSWIMRLIPGGSSKRSLEKRA